MTAGAFPPCSQPIIVVGDVAMVPHPHGGDGAIALRHGVHITWAPTEGDGVLLPLFFGHAADTTIAVAITRDGLRGLISDLLSIEAQLP